MRLISSIVIKKTKAKRDGSCPIYIRVTLNQKRMELSTGIFVYPNDWNEVAQKVDQGLEGAQVYNNRLSKMATDIFDIYNQLVSIGKPFDIGSIKHRYLGGE